ncbi:TonB-dependent receptor [uncultured Psychroserpens sp.]|uniref:TonB-dependent receptor n=1 Tax=uncultured Psychroserpens sp. TaxID=255436 RepID=UPI00263574B7|nr:TonB-dependent receptor plug domain-containing protein [uncultured Psychroserpens sp.]
MKRLFKHIILLFIVLSSNAFCQSLRGVVVNLNNQPLETAYVYNLNSGSHAHTSETGLFVLSKTKVGDSIKIGLLGFSPKIIQLDSQSFESVFSVRLKEKMFLLDEMIIKEALNPLQSIVKLDLQTSPVNSSQEILRKVPGLIIGQHAGGGKAEQLFLRGFDVDHGTDVSISVDGMPVNMVSHAHGQGYSDLHFIIPETIQKIDFGKGTYYAEEGDFNTAAYVNFSTKDHIKNSKISFELGNFNTLRTLGMFNILEKANRQNAYIATEYIATDGPFESSQNFNRLNVFGKYSVLSKNNEKLSITASHFISRWDASGQIPQREVDNGNISRFGAIDDTEGGQTERSNLNVEFNKYITDDLQLKANAFYSNYKFELYSNFTFFLEDSINGDQIRQKENRHIFGANTLFLKNTYLGKTAVDIEAGIGFRHDINNNVELSRTVNRRSTLENIQLGNIYQTNIDAYVNVEFEFGKFTLSPALRLDYFKFLYEDQLQPTYEVLSETKTIASPKLNVFYNAKENLQLYIKSGIGFHSNDTRVIVSNTSKDILPKAYGVDIGNVWKPTDKLFVNTAFWYLFLEQEFVYVGDAGIVEPSGKTERLGVDMGLRYQVNDWLYIDTDATYTKARSLEAISQEDFIPLAPDFTIAGGLSVSDLNGFSGGLKYRYVDDRPANEDNSIIAKGYFITDFNMNYTFNDIAIGVTIENVFDTKWNETQFATKSRLQNEIEPIEEIHFTPGVPFFIKGNISYSF